MNKVRFLPYGKQDIDDDDIAEVVSVLKSDWLTTGPKVAEFERFISDQAGTKYAVVLNSGTSALHAAYFAAGVGPGDEIITSPITFAATANAALYLGAKPVFADIRRDTANINPEEIEKYISPNTKVLVPVDFAGHPADMDTFIKIVKKYNLITIEDAAHALGAKYHGVPVGSLSDMTVFSFHPLKHITTGEGGAVVTDNKDYYEKLIAFRSHGMIREKEKLADYHGPWYHEMHFLGCNYRLTDIQCALGISQLKKLDMYLQRRQDIFDFYSDNFSGVEYIETPVTLKNVVPAWHLYVIRLKGDNPPRREFFEALHGMGILAQVHYIPVYRHPYYQKLGYAKGLCPIAEDYYSRVLSLPLYPSMTLEDGKYVVSVVKSICKRLF